MALDNQCTGAPDYQGEQDNDPANATDCSENSPRAHELHVAELQVLGTMVDGSDPPPGSPKDPIVALTKTGPLTVAAGATITYAIGYENLGPETASSAKLIDTLPPGSRSSRPQEGARTTRRSARSRGTSATSPSERADLATSSSGSTARHPLAQRS